MRIGIIGAMSEEVQGFKKLLENIDEERIGNLTFYTGVMHGKDIVLLETGIGKVNAAIGATLMIEAFDVEAVIFTGVALTFYTGVMHGKDIVLLETGIGKVNAAIGATLMIEAFDVEAVIFTGVAGGINDELDLGDVVISKDLIQHDVDVTAFGEKLGVIPRMEKSVFGEKLGVIPRMEKSVFEADAGLIDLAVKAGKKLKGKVIVGRILSGDQFIASPEKIAFLKKEFNGDCAEMEGAAVGHVCQIFDIPFVVVRTMSDKANSDAHTDYATFMKIAAENSITLVNEMLLNLK